MGGIVQQSGIKKISADKLSIVIIAFNEERNLSALLPDVPEGAEIILVDSHSTDGTTAVARSFGATVYQREFKGFASQKNFAASMATRPWTLMLDADERPDPALWASVAQISESQENVAAAVRRRLVFNGKKMRYGRTKDHVPRLFRSGSFEYQKEIHEVAASKTNARAAVLEGTLWHYSYVDLNDYFARFNRYTTLMADDKVARGDRLPSKTALALRLPLDFAARYFLRLGFLDGFEGFLWAVLGSFYGFIKYAKAHEKSAGAVR